VCGSSSPALENMIHGTFTVANLLGSDKTARAAEQLTAALSGFNDAATRFCTNMVDLMADQARRGAAEGDVRGELDPVGISEAIVGAMIGTRLLCNAMARKGVAAGDDGSLTVSTGRFWELLLAGIVTEASLPYFRQFLSREALRHSRPAASAADPPVAVPEVS
jgi:hypothetical protein